METLKNRRNTRREIANETTYSVGDEVYRQSKRIRKGLSKKLQPKWERPYLITKELHLSYWLREDGKNKITKVHYNRMKRLYGIQVRDTDKRCGIAQQNTEQSHIDNHIRRGNEQLESESVEPTRHVKGAPVLMDRNLSLPESTLKSSSTSGAETGFTIEKILNHWWPKRCKSIKQRWKHVIKWKGYPESDNTWETKDNLPQKLIDEYLESLE